MEDRTNKPGRKLFLFLGIPLMILNCFIGFLGFVAGAVLFVFDFSWLYLLLLWGRRDNLYNRWFKLSVLLFAINISYMYYSVSNPAYWLQELKTGYDRSDLITPNDPTVITLREQFDKWLDTHPNASDVSYMIWAHDGYRKYHNGYQYRYNLENITWDNLTDVGKLMVVDHYIQNIVMEYEYDIDTYGYNDFKATPAQILQPWIDSNFTVKAVDDCDGSAVVTVSLLKNLGYDAYIGSGRGHWFTVVKLENKTNEIFLNTWRSINTYCYFNETDIVVTQSPFYALLDVTLWDEPPSDFITGMEILSMGGYTLGLLISVVASLVITLLIRNPHSYVGELDLPSDEEDRKSRKEKLEKYKFRQQRFNPLNWILDRTYIRVGNPFRERYLAEWINIGFGAIVMFVMVLIFGLNPEFFGQYSYIAMLTVLIVAVRVIESDVIPLKIFRVKDLLVKIKNSKEAKRNPEDIAS